MAGERALAAVVGGPYDTHPYDTPVLGEELSCDQCCVSTQGLGTLRVSLLTAHSAGSSRGALAPTSWAQGGSGDLRGGSALFYSLQGLQALHFCGKP